MVKKKDENDILNEANKKGKKAGLEVVTPDNVEKFFENEEEEFLIQEKEIDFLKVMNEKHAFIAHFGGKPAVISWVYSEVYKKKIIEFMNIDSIITMYCNQYMPSTKGSKDTSVGIGKWWIENPGRREYSTVIFDPREPPGRVKAKDGKDDKDDYYNMWEGFSIEPKKGNWQRTKRHIYKILCNKDPYKFKYAMKWFAWAVQYPGVRPEVAVVFKGKKGAGKGFIFEQFSIILGRHGMNISNAERLTGKHNAHLMLISFLFADEAYYPGGNLDKEGSFKELITQPTIATEPKFRDTKLSNNYLHIGMSTNNDWVIPASGDERRFFINAVDNQYAKGEVSDNERDRYFEPLWNEMEKEGGREAMLYDLLHLQLGDKWHPRKNVPMTEELRRQANMSIGRKEKHILLLLENGYFPGHKNQYNEYIVTSEKLVEYMAKLDPNNKVTMKLKGEVLKKLGCETAKRDNKRYWLFPSLCKMKDTWNKEISTNEWPDLDDWEVSKEEY